MTLSDELKQEVGQEVIRTIVQYSFIAFIVKLCFEILLECIAKCPEPAICRSKLFKSLTGFKSMYICQWVGAACVFFYHRIIAPFTVDDITDPDEAASAQRIDNFIMNYLLFWLIASPFAFIYLRKLGWFQDDALMPPRKNKKKGSKASEKEGEEEDISSGKEAKEDDKQSDKDDDYILADVRKRRLKD